LAVKSKGKGKRGGLRVISHVLEVNFNLQKSIDENFIVFLVTIYDKSEVENITNKDLKNIISTIQKEFDGDMDKNDSI
jgi:hypothetical protein